MGKNQLLLAFFRAWIEARKHKRKSNDEHQFSVHLMKNLNALVDDVMARRYKPNRGIAFVVLRPVIREIFAAPFRDRIIHHFLYDMSADWWDRRLIRDSYSCRLNKGTLDGIFRLEHHIRSVSNNYQEKAYVFKFDIQGFFMSLSRQKLFDRVDWGLKRQFKDDRELYNLLKYLWGEIIFDDPTDGVHRRGPLSLWKKVPKSKSLFCQPPGRGIVIGNLTSQLLSNIYLDQLDRFITQVLGYKHYGRYVDDFYIVVSWHQYEQMKKDVKRIEVFLRDELGLILHPKKRSVKEVSEGVEFLGVVIYPFHRILSKRFCQHFALAAEEVMNDRKGIESIISYVGHGKYTSSKKMIQKIFDHVGWPNDF